MKNIKKLIVLTFTVLQISCSTVSESSPNADYIQWVNPFIGTGGWVEAVPGAVTTYDEIRKKPEHEAFGGLVFPGATVPFGMIQLSPDCRMDGGYGWSAGYHYSDYTMLGFSHNHTSGNGCAFGHYLFMPCTGDIKFEPGRYNNPNREGYRSNFSHVREKASPGYYSVYLDDYDVLAELTATCRVGMHRYTFPANRERHILIDLYHSIRSDAGLEETFFTTESPTSISGYRKTKEGQKTYMYAEFSQPIVKTVLYESGKVSEGLEIKGVKSKAALKFDKNMNEPLIVKVAVSFTSLENAKNNLKSEVPGWDFDEVCLSAEKQWNQELEKIEIQGGSIDERTMFYSALYHTNLTPFTFQDSNGAFLGPDNTVFPKQDFKNYTFFTLWDTYRALHPLYTIIQPSRVNDMINSMLFQAENSKNHLLPLWSLAGENGYNMSGYSAMPTIAEAVVKGFDGFDRQTALRFMVENALNGNFSGHDSYEEKGYVPADKANMSIPKTLEYAYCDWAIATMAKELGNNELYERFFKYSSNYKNVYNPETGFMQPRFENGEFKYPFDPRAVGHQFEYDDFMESNSWQYTWHVMHDVPGLIALMGGNEAFINKLDTLFEQPSYLTGVYAADVSGMVGQLAQGNQPSHHIPYLYSYAGKPWKTQERVREVMRRTYANNPDGLPGNDDGGQTSSWLVFSMIGFYPVDPVSGLYVIGSPCFEEVKIKVADGKIFTVKAKNAGEKNIYIQSATLNGKPWNKPWISHKDIVAGSTIEFEMGPIPNKEWG
ncbi:MAG: GH92 family glycosyl hydrolase [Bacteroidales bacterium]|nr:GH92 family glycosyl hydrolase [Bacteroidales bacterium]